MPSGSHLCLIAGGLLLLVTLPLSAPFAKKLSLEECTALRQQKAAMVERGVGDRLEKGAKWASDHLEPDQIQEVGAFLKLMEDIRFRCGRIEKNSKKKKTGLQANIPLPVRNPRRLTTVKGGQEPSTVNGDDMAAETRAVLSAVTEKGKTPTDGDVSRSGAVAERDRQQRPDSTIPEMRKSLAR